MAFCIECANRYEENKKYCKLCGSELCRDNPVCRDPKVIPPTPASGPAAKSNMRAGGMEERPGNGGAEKGVAPVPHSRRLEATTFTFFIKVAVIIVSVILLVTAAYRGYGGYTLSAQARKTASPITSSDAGSGLAAKALQAAPSSKPPDDGIIQIFEKLRQANLAKDITLFMSCYSSKFPAAGEKRKVTTTNWKRYDYLKLDYRLKDVRSGSNRASGKVQWQITAFSHETRQPLTLTPSFNVVLEKEDGSWKVVSLEKI